MSLVPGQATIGTIASFLTNLPPGPSSVSLTVPGTATAYIGLSSTVTTGNGYPVTSATSPVTIPGYNGEAGGALYAVASGSPATIGWFISAASGGTGL